MRSGIRQAGVREDDGVGLALARLEIAAHRSAFVNEMNPTPSNGEPPAGVG
jgi:hypothetical protein